MKTPPREHAREKENAQAEPNLPHQGATPAASPPAEGEVFERYAIFGNFELRKTSRLRRGYVTCLFSSGELDLREAEVMSELELDVRVLFSSLEVEVPASWNVVVDVHPVFGSTELKGRGEGGGGPTLRVRGLCVFGSLEVKRKRG